MTKGTIVFSFATSATSSQARGGEAGLKSDGELVQAVSEDAYHHMIAKTALFEGADASSTPDYSDFMIDDLPAG